jgi:hypothetical protein
MLNARLQQNLHDNRSVGTILSVEIFLFKQKKKKEEEMSSALTYDLQTF